MILHKFSTSPYSSNNLSQCLTRAHTEDKIILSQDAVYACTHAPSTELLSTFATVYCIADDLAARGIKLNNDIYQSVSYSDFVELTLTCKQVISW